MIKKISFILMFVLFSNMFPLGNPTSEFMVGEITENIKCSNNPEETYVAYVPKSYSPEKKWPVIIAFEPAARGLIPVRLFREPAEKYGYIVVCSNNSQNGPWEDVIRSMNAVWTDIQQRFKIDGKRVYTTGFSGGSRAASLFSQIIGVEPAGIIACGAGLHEKLDPTKIKKSFYYGIIGLEDFNYREFRQLTPKLDKAGVRYCIDYVPGIHKWPQPDVINRAMEWMEIDAVLRNISDLKTIPLEKIFSDSKRYAESLIDSDNFYYGVLYLEGIARHFKMILPVDKIEKRIGEIKETKKFIRFTEEDDLRIRREYQFISNFIRVFDNIENSKNQRTGLQSVMNDLQVPLLKKLNKKKKRPFESYWAKRLLFEIAIKADRYSIMNFAKNVEKKAVLFSELAVETGVNHDWYRFRLASVYAAYGSKNRCFKIVKSLLQTEKNLIKYIRKDPNFNEFLKDPEFMKIFIDNQINPE